MTHSAILKQPKIEDVPVEDLWSLPMHYVESYSNKIVNKDKSHLNRVLMNLNSRAKADNNKRFIAQIEKKCLALTENNVAKRIEEQRAKVQRMQLADGEMTLDEQIAMRDEMEREMKLNPIYKKSL